ncbi:hypothetical protein OAY51_04365 [Candidatus Pelagibacter sp.]|nr:hypothetical protein [Candidatus Pelagibacter sp.]
MAETLKKIIDYLKKDNLTGAFALCETNKDKKIEHIIFNIKGVILFKQEKLELAKIEFLKSINLDDSFIDPYKNLFKLNLKSQSFKSAIENAKKVLELDIQKDPISYFNLALAYDLNKDYKKAIELYKTVEAQNFKEKKILFNNLAKCFLGDQNIDEAKNYYLKALEFDQNDKLIVNNLLILFLRIGDKNKAEYFYKKAQKIDENYIEFKLNKSDYLLSEDKIEDAIKCLKEIIDNSKNYVAYTKLSKIYSMIGDFKKSTEIINQAIVEHPNQKDLKFTRGIQHLIEGEFEKGWEFYELRDSIIKYDSYKNLKTWRGENLKDSTILVTSEQGMGDIIQFSKFLINLSPLCKRIDFVLYDKLLPIFKKKFKNINICKKSEISQNKYDYKISLGSLNKFFFKEKNFNSSDLINFNELRKKHWETIIKNKKKNIGLIWSGNFFGPKEPSRSIELKKLNELLKLNLNFYSFQNEIWDRDKKFFKNSNLIDFSKENFVDIISIIQNLDLVISTDTFFLHLACICNKETWGLISVNSDWRWYEYYKYNPYKSLKIYKQSNYKNWDDVVYLIKNDLKNKFSIS